MTQDSDKMSIIRRVVMVVDIRASTSILEDLKQTDNLARWRNLLIGLKEFILDQRSAIGVDPYKFVGDGWILLFPEDISKTTFVEFLRDLSAQFDMSFDSSISGFLQKRPAQIGLTFGVDSGELVQLEMNEQVEYLGRAINVAARLQDAAKRIEHADSYQALFSNNSFNTMPSPFNHQIRVRSVSVSLKNVANGDRYECLAFCPL